MRRFAIPVFAALFTLALWAPSAFGQAATEGEHSPNMEFVENIPYELKNGATSITGTDVEFAKIGGRQYALGGSYMNGMQIVDITNPRDSRIVSLYDCGVTQGDVQVFRQASKPGRVFVSYASDTTGDGTSTCYQEAAALGFDVKKPNGSGKNGSFIAEITDPLHPKTVSFVEVTQGTHNGTIHPSGNYLYNSNPADPSIVSTWRDPGINVWHQADPYTTTDANGNERTFILVQDEVAGAAGGKVCPSGGFHVYEVTGELENEPVRVGYWNIDDVGLSFTDPTGTCTAHVFRIHEREQVMTAAFYNGGVRVVDISGLAGISLGSTQVTGEGMKEIGYYRMPDADTWSAKTPQINRKTGDFYLFGNDIGRGLDIYHFDGEGTKSKNKGRWMSAQEAKIALADRPAPGTAGTTDICLLGD